GRLLAGEPATADGGAEQLPALSQPAGVHPALSGAIGHFNQVYADYRRASDIYDAAQVAAAPIRSRGADTLTPSEAATMAAEAAAREADALQSGALLKAGIALLE